MIKKQTTHRLLVVGGEGFIGQYVVEEGIKLGWEVTSISLTGSKNKNSPKIRNIVVDISDLSQLKQKISGLKFEYVVNCGGYVDHSGFFKGGEKIINSHFFGLMNIVSVVDRRVLKKLVNIGSSDEYGNVSAPQVELLRERPISPYSLAKTSGSHFLQMLGHTEGFPATTLRLFLVYGPGQGSQRFLPQIITGCLNNKTFPVSEGNQVRDFCYVQDVVRAIFYCLNSTVCNGEVLNIGSGNPITIRQVVETVKHLLNGGQPLYGEIPYRTDECLKLYPDISKAMNLLDWKPAVSLEQGLSRTIQWFKDAT